MQSESWDGEGESYTSLDAACGLSALRRPCAAARPRRIHPHYVGPKSSCASIEELEKRRWCDLELAANPKGLAYSKAKRWGTRGDW